MLLRLLACYVEWRTHRRLAPVPFENDGLETAQVGRAFPVQRAKVSDGARAKAAAKITRDGLPVRSMPTLLDDLATLVLNQIALPTLPDHPFAVATEPTPLQRRAFELLDVEPNKSDSMTSPGQNPTNPLRKIAYDTECEMKFRFGCVRPSPG